MKGAILVTRWLLLGLLCLALTAGCGDEKKEETAPEKNPAAEDHSEKGDQEKAKTAEKDTEKTGGEEGHGAGAAKKEEKKPIDPAIEAKIQATLKEARGLVKAGKTLDAARVYDSLIEYKEQPFFKDLDASITKEDRVRIGYAVHGWTIERLYSIRNRLVSEGRTRVPEGTATIPLDEKDGWGMEIWLQYVVDKPWLVAVVSAGPDRVFKTPDDLVLFQKDPRAKKTSDQPPPPTGEKTAPPPEAKEAKPAGETKTEKKHRRPLVDDLSIPSPQAEKKPPAPAQPEPSTEKPSNPEQGEKSDVDGESSMDINELLTPKP
jgi:hypothetical protein